MNVQLRGIGAYSPARELTNFELTNMVETSDEWIRTRSGIVSRHIAAPGETVITMGCAASREALKSAGIAPDQIDCIVMCSTSPAQIFPAGACLLQKELGCHNAFAFDLQAACSGLLFSLQTARGLMSTMPKVKTALVVASEKMSAMVDWSNRETCVLFGDGACAIVLERNDFHPESILACDLYSDGTFASQLQIKAGGSLYPASPETVAAREHFLTMDGKTIFRQSVIVMTECAKKILKEQRLTPDKIKYLVPHQANIRIIESVAEKLQMRDKIFVNIQHHGNTCSATIGQALYEMDRQHLLQENDLLLLVTAGAGLTWGGMLLRWQKI